MTYARSEPDPAPLQQLHDLGRYREVVARFLALDGAASLREPESLFLAASSAARVGQLEHATTWALRALTAFQRQRDERGAMRATNLLGAIDFERGNVDRAESRFDDARALARSLGDLLMVARTSNNLANIANLRGQTERAFRLYRTALSAFEAGGDNEGAAESWHNLALRFRELGALRDAWYAARQAVQRAEASSRPALVALCLTGSAEIGIQRQQFTHAAAQLDSAEALARTGGDMLLLLEIRRLRARIALETGTPERAAAAAQLVREEAGAHGSALVAAEATAIRALALKALGQSDTAGPERDRALALYRRLGATDLIERFELDWADDAVTAPPE